MLTSTLLALASAALASAHTVITYPGWRGNNLKDNEEFPYGMQWTYPCEYLSHPSAHHLEHHSIPTPIPISLTEPTG